MQHNRMACPPLNLIERVEILLIICVGLSADANCCVVSLMEVMEE